MSHITEQIAEMLDMLPEQEQVFACEVMRKLLLAWDPDFTKLTPTEAARLEIAGKQERFSDDEIDWDNLDSVSLDEIEALRIGEQEIANGETVPADQIDWS